MLRLRLSSDQMDNQPEGCFEAHYTHASTRCAGIVTRYPTFLSAASLEMPHIHQCRVEPVDLQIHQGSNTKRQSFDIYLSLVSQCIPQNLTNMQFDQGISYLHAVNRWLDHLCLLATVMVYRAARGLIERRSFRSLDFCKAHTSVVYGPHLR